MAVSNPISVEDISPQQRNYWEALGRFIEIFSFAENNVLLALRRFSKVRSHIGPVLFSGARMDAASNQIKRIAEAEDWPKERRQRLDTIMAQLGEITRTRNDLLHYGAFESGDEYRVSNALHAHIPSRLRETKITVDVLDAMSMDLLTIMCQLDILQGANVPDFYRQVTMPPERAWLYKPEVSRSAAKDPKAASKAAQPASSIWGVISTTGAPASPVGHTAGELGMRLALSRL